MRPLIVTSGEPAGIDPDLCLSLATSSYPIVILGDKHMLAERASALGLDIAGQLQILHVPCKTPVTPGLLNVENSHYVLELLNIAVQGCLAGEFAGMVTAPVHKGIINQAGIAFSGHTEFLANACKIPRVVMLMAGKQLKVALATTHIPLKDVPQNITTKVLTEVILILQAHCIKYLQIPNPKIFVAGLNPHAGEMGYLGTEEQEIIIPALRLLQEQGIAVSGPFPADTMFNAQNIANCDIFLTMYHDQGLPVIKTLEFADAVNVTCGLPIIRTSVDHGTALELAGTGQADPRSMRAAVEMALTMCAAA